MKIGFFGGSFDPIHRGHVEPVRAALDAVGLDRVLYLPTAQPPHKSGQRMAPAWARFAMVEIALLGEERLQVSPFELSTDRPAYTVETLEHFHDVWPEAELYLLLGEDSFRDLPQWMRWRDIARCARLVVLVRAEPSPSPSPPEPLPEALQKLVESSAVHFLREHPVDVSSTSIRAALARGEEPPSGALAGPVVKYIQKYRLYQ